jgi:choline kinase
MIAVLLAAGVGMRLRPLTESLPKALLDVGGRSLLSRSLEALATAGVHSVVIVTGFGRDQIERAVASFHLSLPVRFLWNPRFASTNNNTSLWIAGSEVRGRQFLLLDADILFSDPLVRRLLDSTHGNALLVRKTPSLGEEEIKVILDREERVVSIGKTIDPRRAAGESIGIEKFSPEASATLYEILDRRRERDEFYEASMQEMIDGGVAMYGVDTEGEPCIEIDTPEDLAAARALFTKENL